MEEACLRWSCSSPNEWHGPVTAEKPFVWGKVKEQNREWWDPNTLKGWGLPWRRRVQFGDKKRVKDVPAGKRVVQTEKVPAWRTKKIAGIARRNASDHKKK